MNWKDYFYFQKRDKLAIILLLILISMSGIIYIITRPSIPKQANISTSNNVSERVDSTNTQTADRTSNKKNFNKPNYPYQEKLKAGETIELNSADTSNFKMIPGIGTGYANKIVKYRNLLGGFYSIDQLKEVWGVDDELYVKIVPFLTLSPQIHKINLNNLELKELNRHPYLNYKQAKVIVDIRDRKGKIESIDRLAMLEEFSSLDIERLSPYLSFE